MSNFTKSIMYSGIVLVAGLIAVFSIYENMDASKEAQLGAITPAAGEESVVEPEAAADTMTTDGAEEAAPAAEGEAAAPATTEEAAPAAEGEAAAPATTEEAAPAAEGEAAPATTEEAAPAAEEHKEEQAH